MRALALCGLLAAIIWLPASAYAQAKLQLYPTRITLKEGQNSAELNVINAGSATGRYRIELADMKMPEKGALEMLEKETLEYSLVPYARITPRSVEVPPSQSQKFRMLLRVPRDLADGEYRTHAHVLMSSTDVEAEKEPTGEGFGVRLTPRFRVSVPVVFRKGETWFRAELTQLALERNAESKLKPALNMHFTTEGNRSTWGNLVATLTQGDQVHELYRLNGFTIYRGTNSRYHRAALELPEGVALNPGDVITVTYTETEADGGELITQKSFQL